MLFSPSAAEPCHMMCAVGKVSLLQYRCRRIAGFEWALAIQHTCTCTRAATSIAATELGFVEATPNDTLSNLRPKIDQLFANRGDNGRKPPEDSWRFLNGKYAPLDCSGRVQGS